MCPIPENRDILPVATVVWSLIHVPASAVLGAAMPAAAPGAQDRMAGGPHGPDGKCPLCRKAQPPAQSWEQLSRQEA